jgi:hypothetical protein
MNFSHEMQQQRMAIRLRLQAQRQRIADRLFLVPVLAAQADATNAPLLSPPRSMTMRLLGRHPALVFVLIGEVVPLLLRYYLRR